MNVAGASQLAGITATIIMLVPRTGSPSVALASRVGEVGWGVTVGITIVWLAARLKALRA
jgi:hypothetical protein